MLIGTIDPLLAGITEEAAQLIDAEYAVAATANYYFMVVSTFLVTIIGALVSIHIVEPKLGAFDPLRAEPEVLDTKISALDQKEKKALRHAGLGVVAVLGLMALTLLPEWGVLRDAETGDRMRSPFFTGFAVWILLFFLAIGFAYGRVVGTIRNDRDMIDGMAKAMSSLGLYIVIIFFAAQFVAFFAWSNLGAITAVNGATFLQEMGLTGPALFIGFILVCALVNLMLGSASAQWAMTAPIFVPMLMLIGYSPEVIQAAYRIGNSTTNIITPMMSYFGLILAFAARYDRNVGIGTLLAMMLPYSIFFTIAWMLLFFLWVFGLGLPVGPGSPTYYTPG